MPRKAAVLVPVEQSFAPVTTATRAELPARKTGRLLQLDVVRGLSILMVLVTHQAVYPEAHGWLYAPVVLLHDIGWSGVDVFFVLSGYLVGGLLMREFQETQTLQVGRFLARRAFKVWPTYFVFLFSYFAVRVALPNETGSTFGARAAYLWSHHWANVLQVQNYVASTGNLGWLWSLGVEEHFYLLLPWALVWVLSSRQTSPEDAAAQRRQRMVFAFGAIALGCLLLRALSQHFATRTGDAIYAMAFPTHLRIDSLFCGVFLAYLVRFHGDAVRRLLPYRYGFLLLGLSAWIPHALWGKGQGQLFLYPVGMTLLYLGATGIVLFAHLSSQVETQAPRSWPGLALHGVMAGMAWLGVRSYAIYVWHGYFAKPFAHRMVLALHLNGLTPGWNGWLHDGIYLLANVLVGAVMYSLVEAPVLRLRTQFVPSAVAG